MESDSARHEERQRRIRTLTNILHQFGVQKSPCRQRTDISPLLPHFTTLLTCDDLGDDVAVAGSLAPNQRPRALVVAQNPHSVGKIHLTVVEKDARPLEEVVTGSANPDLVAHIADILTALSAFDPHAINSGQQQQSLERFVLSRCWCTFSVRFEKDTRLCGGKRLYQVLSEWKPDPHCLELTPTWVDPPEWLLRLQWIPKVTSREVKGQVQWEFSDDTKRVWAKILAVILVAVDSSIQDVKTAKGEEALRKAMGQLNARTGYLYALVHWRAGIVKRLLTETDVVSHIPTSFGDTTRDLDQEPGETKGHQVYRYLRMVTAWHAAVNDLCYSSRRAEFLNNSVVGLVEVPPSPSSVLSLEEISAEFLSRFPTEQGDSQAVLEIIRGRHPASFSGCVHAEATLMGLLNYYSPGSTHLSDALDVDIQNSGTLQQIVQPMAEPGNVAIATSNKCCWCCDWLAKNLETEFTLPGTHGIMFPWDPPKIGVGMSTLEELEKELWKELHRAVYDARMAAYSRQRFPSGPPVVESPERFKVDKVVEDESFMQRIRGLNL